MHKLDEVKVMRDPIHGYIHVEDQIIWDCINAKEFQRLRRIHQLGGDFQVYHTAEHSRFAHSLGVYEIVRRMVNEVKELKEALSEKDKITVMLAALLHDIGHGPFSHAFEAICDVKHEIFTQRIILEDSEINAILCKEDPELPSLVAAIINYQHPNDLLNQLVSGQLDADRMDYLLRDAYFTGTSYGNFDLERIIRTMRIRNGKVVVKESGIHTVEDYIMARYHMYWQVYLHPVSRSYENMIYLLFKRMKDIYAKDPDSLREYKMFLPFLRGGDISIQDHFILDEPAAFYGFTLLTQCNDVILINLATSILNRHLFEYTQDEGEVQYSKIQQKCRECGYDPAYYLTRDEVIQRPYQPYKTQGGHNIYVLCDKGDVKELSEVSDIVNAIVHGKNKEDKRIFFPKAIL